MKRSHSIALALCVVLAGCVSPALKNRAILEEGGSKEFVTRMEKGLTTRDEEQRFIKQQDRAWTYFRDGLGLQAAKQ